MISIVTSRVWQDGALVFTIRSTFISFGAFLDVIHTFCFSTWSSLILKCGKGEHASSQRHVEWNGNAESCLKRLFPHIRAVPEINDHDWSDLNWQSASANDRIRDKWLFPIYCFCFEAAKHHLIMLSALTEGFTGICAAWSRRGNLRCSNVLTGW